MRHTAFAWFWAGDRDCAVGKKHGCGMLGAQLLPPRNRMKSPGPLIFWWLSVIRVVSCAG
jgi:hypothetical protein